MMTICATTVRCSIVLFEYVALLIAAPLCALHVIIIVQRRRGACWLEKQYMQLCVDGTITA